MRGIHCIPVINSQITTFVPLKRVDSMSYPSGISVVTSPTAPDGGSLWIRTSGLTASECRTGYYYDWGSGEGRFKIQSDE